MVALSTLQHIVERHADEAAFLWRLRDVAAVSPSYTLEALADLDERVEAHLDGLRVAGPHAWEACAEALTLESAGEVFVVAALGLHNGADEKVAEMLDLAGTDDTLVRGMVSAIGWTPVERLGATLAAFLDPLGPPALQRLGIAGAALHRLPLGPTLQQALFSPDRSLLSRALRAVGELGRKDLLPFLVPHLTSEDWEVRFWAAWSTVLLGDSTAASVLWSFAEDDPCATAAYRLAARVTPIPDARRRLDSVGDDRIAFEGLTALGDPGALSRLVGALRDAELARVAAHAIATITGLDTRHRSLVGSPPEGFAKGPNDDPEDDDVAMDPDGALPWPNADALEAACKSLTLSAGVRHLAGEPISDGVTARVLRHGTQSQRIGAAFERCVVAAGEPLAEVRAPGFRQLARGHAPAAAHGQAVSP